MSSSTHQITINGKDNTAQAFKSVQARAISTGNRIASVMGGAIAAAGAYLSAKMVADSVKELGELSDVAARAGVGVEELTQAMTGLQVLGIKMDQEGLTKVFQQMRKNTGREGMEGLYQTIEEIAKIPDAAERSKAAMAAFGRSGMELMPLIDAAQNGTDALRGVISVMPGVSQAAADAGDDAADAMQIACNGIKSLWLEGVGSIIEWIGSFFPGGIRQAALEAVNWVEYGLKMAYISVKQGLAQIYTYTFGIIENIGAGLGGMIGTWFGGGSFGEGLSAYVDAYNKHSMEQDRGLEELDKANQARANKWTEEFEVEKARIAEFSSNYKKALGKSRATSEADESNNAGGGSSRSTRISNSLIAAGTNAARKLAIMGPEFSEQKKQTAYQKAIADNTKEMIEKLDRPADEYSETDLGL